MVFTTLSVLKGFTEEDEFLIVSIALQWHQILYLTGGLQEEAHQLSVGHALDQLFSTTVW